MKKLVVWLMRHNPEPAVLDFFTQHKRPRARYQAWALEFVFED